MAETKVAGDFSIEKADLLRLQQIFRRGLGQDPTSYELDGLEITNPAEPVGVRLDRLRSIVVEWKGGGRSVRLEVKRQGARIVTSDDGVDFKKVTAALCELLSRRRRVSLRRILESIKVIAAIGAGISLVADQSMFFTFLLIFVVTLIFRRSFKYIDYDDAEQSFWNRNRDAIYMAVISTAISAIGGFIFH